MDLPMTVVDWKQLDDDWEYHVDNEFASGLFSTFKASSLFDVPEARVSSHLCKECQAVREELWRPAFSVTYDVSKLEARSKLKQCDLCGLFWRTCERHGGTVFPTVQFDSVDSSLRMNGGGLPVLSIFRSPGRSTPTVVSGIATIDLC